MQELIEKDKEVMPLPFVFVEKKVGLYDNSNVKTGEVL